MIACSSNSTGTIGAERVSATRLAVAVCGELAEVLLELVGCQPALSVTSEHRLHAQVRPQEDAPVGKVVLDHVVPGEVAAERDVSLLHVSKCRTRDGSIQVARSMRGGGGSSSIGGRRGAGRRDEALGGAAYRLVASCLH